ncbi:MAG TPA: sulfur transferase domain-containing protein [Pyrinomonadaceae bacterium]|nr:sulfur transferase domain-containing protein [Pyrinomonadaceae bacterium]
MSNNYNPVPVGAPIVPAGLNCSQVGDFYITAQPTDPQGIETANSLGVVSVVCLRDSAETANPPYPAFDPQEDATATSLGMNFVNVPFPHGMQQSQFDVRAGVVLAALDLLPKPLLMHCSSGDRASALWAVHLMEQCGLPQQEAIGLAQTTGLKAFLSYVQNYSPAQKS